jgi:hypothetical protein
MGFRRHAGDEPIPVPGPCLGHVGDAKPGMASPCSDIGLPEMPLAKAGSRSKNPNLARAVAGIPLGSFFRRQCEPAL